MRVPRRLVNVIGSAIVVAIGLVGTLLMVMISVDTHITAANVAEAASANQFTRARLADLAHQEVMVPWLQHDLEVLRKQITEADERSDASTLASAAAKYSGARIISITFADPQVFAAPTGTGMGDDGTPKAPPVSAEPNTPHVQLPVTFEVEVSSTAQAAAFLNGLGGGPRLLQVVQAQSSQTNEAKLFTVTVDALIFSNKG